VSRVGQQAQNVSVYLGSIPLIGDGSHDHAAEIVGNMQRIESPLPVSSGGEPGPELLNLLRRDSGVFGFSKEQFLRQVHTTSSEPCRPPRYHKRRSEM